MSLTVQHWILALDGSKLLRRASADSQQSIIYPQVVLRPHLRLHRGRPPAPRARSVARYAEEEARESHDFKRVVDYAVPVVCCECPEAPKTLDLSADCLPHTPPPSPRLPRNPKP